MAAAVAAPASAAASRSSGRTTAILASAASVELVISTLKLVTPRTSTTSISTPAVSGAAKVRQRPASRSGRARKKATTANDVTVISASTPSAPRLVSQVKSLSTGSAPAIANAPTTTSAISDWQTEPTTGAPVRGLTRPNGAGN